MSKIFTAEHYRTSEQYGMSFENEWPEVEVLAEIDLTLNVLQGEDTGLSLGHDDIVAHHYLHYGGLRRAGRFAVEMALSGDYEESIRSEEILEKTSQLEKKLRYVLSPNRLSGPVPLGRFQLGWIPAELSLPEEFVDYFESTVPIDPIPARNPGPFLYPRDNVLLSYAGSEKSDTPFGQLMFSELAQNNPDLVEKCHPNIGRDDLTYPDDMGRLYLEEIRLEENGSSASFIAISSESVLFAVEPAAMPRDN